MAEHLKFKMDWQEYYNSLSEKQKAHFLELFSKYCHYKLDEVLIEIEDMQVIV